jgi:hypothetical protein
LFRPPTSFFAERPKQDVGARHKAGHDDGEPRIAPPLVLFVVVYKLNKWTAANIDKAARWKKSRNETMKASTLRKADRIAKARAPKSRMRFFWWELDETREQLDARIRASIASGETSPNDRIVTFTWTRPEDGSLGG